MSHLSREERLRDLELNSARIQAVRFALTQIHPQFESFRKYLLDQYIEFATTEFTILGEIGILGPQDLLYFHCPQTPSPRTVSITIDHFLTKFRETQKRIGRR
jgi:hypothetical protein